MGHKGNGIVEVTGSIPVGSTKENKGLAGDGQALPSFKEAREAHAVNHAINGALDCAPAPVLPPCRRSCALASERRAAVIEDATVLPPPKAMLLMYPSPMDATWASSAS